MDAAALGYAMGALTFVALCIVITLAFAWVGVKIVKSIVRNARSIRN